MISVRGSLRLGKDFFNLVALYKNENLLRRSFRNSTNHLFSLCRHIKRKRKFISERWNLNTLTLSNRWWTITKLRTWHWGKSGRGWKNILMIWRSASTLFGKFRTKNWNTALKKLVNTFQRTLATSSWGVFGTLKNSLRR